MIRQYHSSFWISKWLFGGTTFGAYSAANSFLDGLAHTLTFQEGRRAISLNFSMWDNLGLSKGHTGAALTVRKGFQLIGKKQGLHSFCLGARLNEAHLFIGLDGANPEIAAYLQPAQIPTFEKKLFIQRCLEKKCMLKKSQT